MANAVTPTYSFIKPEVGADTNAWGGHLNGNFDIIDAQMVSRTLVTAQTMAGALNLPANGLNVGSGQLQVTGGNVSMSGQLSVTGSASFSSTLSASTAPTAGAHLTNKTYVDAQDALALLKAGGTMTGLLVLSADPSAALGAATKQYADAIGTAAQAKTINAGTGLTGGGALSTNPTLLIAAGGVGTTQLADNGVTTAKILDANVTPAKLSQPLTNVTAQTASGTAVNFTSIPSWAKRIIVAFDNVGFSTSDIPIVQIGPSGGLETTNYASASVAANGGSVARYDPNFGFPGPGFVLGTGAGTSANSGLLTLTHMGSNVWAASGNLGGYGLNNVIVHVGRKTLAGALALLTVKGLSGASFLAGTINIQYE
jgi:hypothetical protein